MLSFPSRGELRARPLSTSRLLLSPLEAAQGVALWEAVDGSRAFLQPWLPWVPYQKSAESSHRFAEASASDWDNGRALRFAIRRRDDDLLLGVIGLEACVEMHRSCDLGYWLRQEGAGQGFMTEAARACLAFGFRTVGVHRIRVAAATGNHPSLRVIGRLGFQFEGIARHAEWCDGRWLDHAIFSLLDHEWRGR